MQERCCALGVKRGRRDQGLKSRSRPSGHQHAVDHLYLQDRQSCLRLLAEDAGKSAVQPPPCSSLHLGEPGVIKAQPLARAQGKQCSCPQPTPLTCREISSTSHSSSHNWATAHMATTVEARMTTSPIWRGKCQTGGQRKDEGRL